VKTTADCRTHQQYTERISTVKQSTKYVWYNFILFPGNEAGNSEV